MARYLLPHFTVSISWKVNAFSGFYINAIIDFIDYRLDKYNIVDGTLVDYFIEALVGLFRSNISPT